MMSPLWRSYDPNLIEKPTVYRLNEAVMHFGESIKEMYVQTSQPSGTHSDLSIQIPPRSIPFGGAGRIPKGSLKQAHKILTNQAIND
ncbi:hypothetical protein YC2023_038858 [Brassica napus]